MTFSITTLSIITFSRTTFSIMTFRITSLSKIINKNDTQHCDTQHNCSVLMLSVVYAECHNKPSRLGVIMLNVVTLSVMVPMK